MYRFEEFFFNDSVTVLIDIVKLFTIIFFIAHWIGCFFFAVSYMNISTDPNNWIVEKGLADGDVWQDQYLTSIYWAFMTMTTVGYGDVFPYSSSEKLYTIFSMIVACGVFAWIMGSIGSFVNRGDANLGQLKDEVRKINQYMIHNNLPKKFK
jgi:hyperpolarization activated cyclic nucleotide-gated potassium channel 2